MRKPIRARLAMRALGLCALFFTASGVVALVIAGFGAGVHAPSVFILSIGAGGLFGVAMSSVACHAAFATPWHCERSSGP
jgi:hypothetical protein